MKKLLLGTALATSLVTAAFAGSHSNEVKLGVFLGFTGPLESVVAHMGPAAEFAAKEVNDSGKLLGGASVTTVRADTTCVDAGAATTAIERLVTSDKVNGVVGGDCSGVTGAALMNVAVPNGMVMISPSATSPGLSHMNNEDQGLFFRTAPSDARQGVVMAEVLMDKGIKSVAVSYTNNDYGKGLADAFQAAYEAAGGSVTLSSPHEDGKADYSAEVAALGAAGGDVLVVAGYSDQGGAGITQASLDSGAFDTFFFPDGMISDDFAAKFGDGISSSTGTRPSPSAELAENFANIVGDDAGFSPSGSYAPESYDAAALLLLAMQAAGSSDPADYKDKVMDVANAPGEKINAGELAKGLEILANGGEIDYVGATGVELIGPGESSGSFGVVGFEDGKVVTNEYR